MTVAWTKIARPLPPRIRGGYVVIDMGRGKRRQREHTILAEKALGRKLHGGEQVHHANGNKLDNSAGNLVLCPDARYHQLLEMRTRAVTACGNANWRKCRECGKYDDPNNMRIWADTTRPGCEKASHYRWAGECVNRGERCQIRRPHSKPALRRGQKRYHGQLAPAHRLPAPGGKP